MFLSLLILFRPVLIYLILGSFGISKLISSRRKYFEIVFAVMLIVVLIISSQFITIIFDKYFGGSFSYMIYTKEETGMVKSSIGFTYIINILSGLIGPLPTILPSFNKIVLSIYAPGLLYKNFISVFYLFGTIIVFKRKLTQFYPIALFALMETLSLVFILEGLELRKSLPHFPFIYIIAFGFVSFYHNGKDISFNTRNRINKVVNFSVYLVFLTILFWNTIR
jgi:hypothetical protein